MERKMNELIKRDSKKGELLYLEGIDRIHMKHMQILTDLMHRPTIQTEIPNILTRDNRCLNTKPLHSELMPPNLFQRKKSQEEIDYI
jgi:hypothetical protein